MENSIFKQYIKPGYQALLIIALYGFILLILKFLDLIEYRKFVVRFCWLFGTAFLLFYIIINSIFSFTAADKMTYFRNSIFTYVACLFVVVGLNTLISGKVVYEVDTYSWILLVFSMVYIVFITIINLLRKIVEMAVNQNKKIEDEN
ncbi:MAG: hypothetical protein IPK91_03355 [Saprospiraceae bacterium]|nr:hypothetical protein [Saprospiraceae bacterium]